MADTSAPGNASALDGESLHVVPVWTYAAVYVALLALTASTVAAAYVNLGPMSNVVAVGIAVAKAALVAVFFMHLRWSGRLTTIILVGSTFWLIHLMSGTLADYFTRRLLDVPGK